mgnify:CR=1 FL=1
MFFSERVRLNLTKNPLNQRFLRYTSVLRQPSEIML